MSERIWFVAVDGNPQEEQSSAEEVRALLAEKPDATVLVWKEGMEGWVDVETVAELAKPAAEEDDTNAPTVAAGMVALPADEPTTGGKADFLRRAGFVKSLFDFRFDSFVTPKMIAVLYGLVMVFIGIGFLAILGMGAMSLVNGIRFSSMGLFMTGIVWIVLSPLCALLYLAFARMFFEMVIVMFKIKESAEKLVEGGMK